MSSNIYQVKWAGFPNTVTAIVEVEKDSATKSNRDVEKAAFEIAMDTILVKGGGAGGTDVTFFMPPIRERPANARSLPDKFPGVYVWSVE